jgi:GcrA cell cycle regulator
MTAVRWSERRDELIRHHNAGLIECDIAAAMRLPYGAIHGEAARLRRAGKLQPRPPAYYGQRSPEAPVVRRETVPVPGPVSHGWRGWTPTNLNRLRELWADGYSTEAIGKSLGTTKNAIVGKAHRLDLPGRESPIIRRGEPRGVGRRGPRAPLPPGAATLPALASVQAAPTPRPAAQAPPPPAPPPARSGRVVTCAWPIGEPGTRGPNGFRFCDAASEPGKPYCADHCRKAYQPRTAERERVA